MAEQRGCAAVRKRNAFGSTDTVVSLQCCSGDASQRSTIAMTRRNPVRRLRRRGVSNWVLSFAVALLLTPTLGLRAQQLPVRVYTTADGLSHDRVLRIVIDSRGFLWFCTLQGLNRFDGQQFIEYSIRDGLGSASVFDVLETREGDYWVATGAGISRLARAHVNKDGAAPGPLGPAQLFTTYSVGPGANTGNKVDKKAPTIAIASPTPGATYGVNARSAQAMRAAMVAQG